MRASSDGYRVISRREAARWLLACAVVCAIAIPILLRLADFYAGDLQALARKDTPRALAQARVAIQFVLLSVAALSAAMGACLMWYGYRAARTATLPPPGSWILEGRPVFTGRKAAAIARLYLAAGLAIIGVGCTATYYAWTVVPEVFQPRGSPARIGQAQPLPTDRQDRTAPSTHREYRRPMPPA
jgi:hypothetical protein